MNQVVVSGLFVYPVKSCAGIAVSQAELSITGLAADRRWMLVNQQGRFITQREQGRLALVIPSLQGEGLQIEAPGMPVLTIAGTSRSQPCVVTVWQDRCQAYDEGETAAAWFSEFLGQPARLVRFDEAQVRLSNRDWTGEVQAPNQFSDGFPVLVISTASLAELNSRLAQPLPMNRFRPNVVVDGLPAYGEDRVHELYAGKVRLRIVKPCTRCKITTTDQATGVSQGMEPLDTLRGYRLDRTLRGVTFGQNAIIVAGTGTQLRVGQQLDVVWRQQ